MITVFPIASVLVPAATSAVNVSGNGWTSGQIDDLLVSLVSGGATGGTLNLTGNDPMSAIGGTAYAVLITRGWTITWNGPVVTQDSTFIVNGDGSWKIVIASTLTGTTYQWQYLDPYVSEWADGGPTTDTYDNPAKTNGALDPSTTYYYRCGVTRGGITTYTNGIPSNSPLIQVQPSDTDVTTGDPLSLDVEGYFDSVQWKKDGVDIDGATTVPFTIGAVAGGDAGVYTAVVSTTSGAHIASSTATVNVT